MKIFGRSAFFLMVGVIAVGLLTFTPRLAEATSITFEYNFEFSEGDEPVSSTLPWLTATFDDEGSPGSVTLTLLATNLSDAEFVTGWYFNLNPDLDPDELDIEHSSGVADSDITTDENNLNGGGGGYYDLGIEFPTDAGIRFGSDGIAEFLISGIDGLTAGDFNWLAAPHGGHGPFQTAAHVQGIGPDAVGSGWVAPVPEPATMVLFGSGLIGLAALGRRKFLK